MKKKFFTFLLVVLSAITTEAQQLTLLLPSGLTNGEIKSTDTLDALVQNGNTFQLIPIQVKMDSIYNPAMGEKIPTYSFNTDKRPIVLFKNDDFMKSGVTGKYSDFRFLEPDSSISIKLNERLFQLRAYGEKKQKSNAEVIKNYRLELIWPDEKESEILKTEQTGLISKSFIEAPKIIWIGDLNNDDLPDLIIEESTHYASVKRGFYLSKDLHKSHYSRTVLVEGSMD